MWSVYRATAATVILLLATALVGTACSATAPRPAAITGSWHEVEPAPPPAPVARVGHSSVYDPKAQRMIVFGGGTAIESGRLSEVSDETWAYDPQENRWANLAPRGPVPRARVEHVMAYDPVSEKTILVGGSGLAADHSGEPLEDTWAYDSATNTWTELRPVGSAPSSSTAAAVVYDPSIDKLVLFANTIDTSTGDLVIDVWCYDRGTNEWSELASPEDRPEARLNEAIVYDSGGSRILVFGGLPISPESQSAPFLNDLWSFNAKENTWTELHPKGQKPSASYWPVSWYDSGRGIMFVFSGWFWGKGDARESWAYDPGANRWSEIESSASPTAPRFGESVVFDPMSEQAILYGGASGENVPSADLGPPALSSLYTDVWAFGVPGGQ